ncbi:MAG: PQQ-binding-like beta-propeller repeat protein [Deltaproteobacteria bacterium]|nr:PQQ-binding-like beta-propeller repeat protein [Deltaproteobacteria bacterium]
MRSFTYRQSRPMSVFGLSLFLLTFMHSTTSVVAEQISLVIPIARDLPYVKARRLIVEGERLSALNTIQQGLDQGEVLASDIQSNIYFNLRNKLQDLLLSMPENDLNHYEEITGIVAKKSLLNAVHDRSIDAITEIARRYRYTAAGSEAILIQGHYYWDHSQCELAIKAFRRYLAHPFRTAGASAEALFRLSYCEAKTGKIQQSHESWAELVALLGKNLKLLPDGRNLSSLKSRIEAAQSNSISGRTATSKFHRAVLTPQIHAELLAKLNKGDISGLSLKKLKVDLPVLAGNQTINTWRAKANHFRILPAAFEPLVTDGKLLFAGTSTLNSYDLSTLSRQWSVGTESLLEPVFLGHYSEGAEGWWNANIGFGYYQSRYKDLFNITKGYEVFGTPTVDGSNAYLIEYLPTTMDIEANDSDDEDPTELQTRKVIKVHTNRSQLSAFDLQTGQKKWHFNFLGEKTSGNEQSNTIFLGPPLVLGGRLYALAEQVIEASENGSQAAHPSLETRLYLLCLKDSPHSPKKVELEWMSPLAVHTAVNVQERQPMGFMSYQDGILFVVVDDGFVLAFDLLDRTIQWASQHNHSAVTLPGSNIPRSQLQHWLTIPQIRNGKFVFAPPVDSIVTYRDFATGKPLWEAQRDDDLYFATYTDDKAVYVGNTHVRALSLKDGSPAWKTGIAFPAGFGVNIGKYYFVPLRNSTIVIIDTSNGATLGSLAVPCASDGDGMGNILLYDDKLIIQNPTSLSIYSMVH